jgi:hypothetical protein
MNMTRSSYLFKKLNTHFKPEEHKLTLVDTATHHSATKIQKIHKAGSSPQRDDFWCKINNTSQIQLSPIDRSRLNQIIILSGELFRFSDGHLPKYRMWVEEKNEENAYPVSKFIPDSEDFFEYFKENIFPHQILVNRKWAYQHNPRLEGMARGIFGKYFYLDNDFHEGNALVDKKKYFHAIDHDWCFIPVTWDLHGKHVYGEADAPRTYNKLMTLKDYDNLPLFKDYQGSNCLWTNKGFIPYLNVIAKDPDFINEKHFAALKTLATQDFQKYLVAYHIEDGEDAKGVGDILTERFNNFSKVLPQSASFMTYLRLNRITALQAIIFEVNDFFNHNRHYLLPRNKQNNETYPQWQVRIQPEKLNILKTVIEMYSQLLFQFGEHSLDEVETTDLLSFSMAIARNKVDELQSVKSFYLKSNMYSFADQVETYLQAAPREQQSEEKVAISNQLVSKDTNVESSRLSTAFKM